MGTAVDNSAVRTVKGACDISAPVRREKTDAEIEEEETANQLGITVERLRSAKAYAQFLVFDAKKRGNKIKPSTVRAKVAKKFNIKLS